MEQEENIDSENFEEYNSQDSEETKEGVDSSISAEDFDPERVLYDIKKTFNGFDKRDGQWVRVTEPLCRSEFINLYINSLRSLLNFHNLFSQKSSPDAAFEMLEGLKEITYAAVDYGVEEEHLETFINVYDTLKNTFYGIIVDGKGTENVKQVLSSVYKDIASVNNSSTENQSPINWNYVKKSLKN